jgi:hypothetical protein
MKTSLKFLIVILLTSWVGNAQTVNSKMSFGGYEIAEMTKTTTHSTLSFKNAKGKRTFK